MNHSNQRIQLTVLKSEVWKQWLIFLTWFILIQHPSLLIFDMRMWSVACRSREILILEPIHLVAFMLCFHSINCRSNLNILKFVACPCGELGLVVASLISSALNCLPPTTLTWPGTRLQLKCYFLRGPIPETPAFSKSAVSIIISHWTFHFSFIAVLFRIRFIYEWLKTQNENGLNEVEFYFSLI